MGLSENITAARQKGFTDQQIYSRLKQKVITGGWSGDDTALQSYFSKKGITFNFGQPTEPTQKLPDLEGTGLTTQQSKDPIAQDIINKQPVVIQQNIMQNAGLKTPLGEIARISPMTKGVSGVAAGLATPAPQRGATRSWETKPSGLTDIPNLQWSQPGEPPMTPELRTRVNVEDYNTTIKELTSLKNILDNYPIDKTNQGSIDKFNTIVIEHNKKIKLLQEMNKEFIDTDKELTSDQKEQINILREAKYLKEKAPVEKRIEAFTQQLIRQSSVGTVARIVHGDKFLPEDKALSVAFPYFSVVGNLVGELEKLITSGNILKTIGLPSAVGKGISSKITDRIRIQMIGSSIVSGATFGLNAFANEVAKARETGIIKPSESAKNIVESTLFGNALGPISAIPNITIASAAAGTLAASVTYAKTGNTEESIKSGLLMSLFMGLTHRTTNNTYRNQAYQDAKAQLSEYIKSRKPDITPENADKLSERAINTFLSKTGAFKEVEPAQYKTNPDGTYTRTAEAKYDFGDKINYKYFDNFTKNIQSAMKTTSVEVPSAKPEIEAKPPEVKPVGPEAGKIVGYDAKDGLPIIDRTQKAVAPSGAEVPEAKELIEKVGQYKVIKTGITAEDIELKPDQTKNIPQVAMKLGDKIYAYKYGEQDIFNHSDIAQKHNLFNKKGIIPGFVDTEGDFVYQYKEDVPTAVAPSGAELPKIKIIGERKDIINQIDDKVKNTLTKFADSDIYIVPTEKLTTYGRVGDRPFDINLGEKAFKSNLELNTTILHEAIHKIEFGDWNTSNAKEMRREWAGFDWKNKTPAELKKMGFNDPMWTFRKPYNVKGTEFMSNMSEEYFGRPEQLKKLAKPIYDFFDKWIGTPAAKVVEPAKAVLPTVTPEIKSMVEGLGARVEGWQEKPGMQPDLLITDNKSNATLNIPQDKVNPEFIKTRLEEKAKLFEKTAPSVAEVKDIPTELEPLAQEARKYNTAEEFVKAQLTVYHGTTSKFDVFQLGAGKYATGANRTDKGIYFTDKKNIAKDYSHRAVSVEKTKILKEHSNYINSDDYNKYQRAKNSIDDIEHIKQGDYNGYLSKEKQIELLKNEDKIRKEYDNLLKQKDEILSRFNKQIIDKPIIKEVVLLPKKPLIIDADFTYDENSIDFNSEYRIEIQEGTIEKKDYWGDYIDEAIKEKNDVVVIENAFDLAENPDFEAFDSMTGEIRNLSKAKKYASTIYIVINPSIIKTKSQLTDIWNKAVKTPATVPPEAQKVVKEAVLPQEQAKTQGVVKEPYEEQIAYHGTPYQIDKFNLTKIGYGEGFQAFGYGIYFTSNKDIASYYANAIYGSKEKLLKMTIEDSYSKLKQKNDKLKNVRDKTTVSKTQIKAGKKVGLDLFQKGYYQAKAYLKERGLSTSGEEIINVSTLQEDAKSVLNNLKVPSKKEINKNIYKVTIDNRADLLNYSKILTDSQKEKILKGFESKYAEQWVVNKRYKFDEIKKAIKEDVYFPPKHSGTKPFNGIALLSELVDFFDSSQKASEFLAGIGIDGIEYPSANALTPHKPMRGKNYVIWNTDVIKSEVLADYPDLAEQVKPAGIPKELEQIIFKPIKIRRLDLSKEKKLGTYSGDVIVDKNIMKIPKVRSELYDYTPTTEKSVILHEVGHNIETKLPDKIIAKFNTIKGKEFHPKKYNVAGEKEPLNWREDFATSFAKWSEHPDIFRKEFPQRTKFFDDLRLTAEIGKDTVKLNYAQAVKHPAEVPELKKEIRVFEPVKMKPKEVKPFIRKITGQIKIGKLIREDIALKRLLQREQSASKLAFSLGKKEGVALHKSHIEEIEARMKVREEQKAKINKMIDKMKAIDTEKMSPQEAEPIKDLLKDLDLVKRQKPTMLKLARTRDFLNTNPDAEMPDYMLERLARLDKRNLNDITIDELGTVYNAVMHYTHLNKVKNQIKVGQEIRRAEQVLTDSIGEMKPPKEVKTEIVQSQKSRFSKFKDVGRLIKDTFGIRHDHYDLIIESLAGANSTMDKVLYQGIKEGITNELSYKQDVYKQFNKDLNIENFQKKHNIKDIANWQNETVKVGKFNLTKGERMSLYRHSLNADNIKAILEGGFGFRMSDTPNRVYRITQEELDKVLNNMTPAEKEFAGQPIQDLFDRQYEALNKVFYEKNGYPMPKEDNYYPKRTMPLARGSDIEKETALEKFKGKWTRVGLEKGMLEKRLRVQLPLYLNNIAYDVNKSVLNASAYVGLELPLSNASKLLYNRDFKAELVNRYGQQTWIEIEKGLRDIAGDYQSYSTTEELALKLKNKLSTAILGFNPFVMAKQILSYPLYNVYIDMPYMIQGFIDYIMHPFDTIDRHKLYSPEYLERVEGGYERDVADVFKTGAEKRLYKGKTSIPEKLMGGIKLFDINAVNPGMQGAVLQVLDELKTGKLSDEVKKALDIKETDIPVLKPEDKMKLAYKFADYCTERTQPMFSPEHRSSLSRGSGVEQFFTHFSSFTNQALNLIRRTWRAAEDKNDPQTYGKLLKVLFYLLVVNTGGIMAIDEIRDRIYGKKKKKEQGIISKFGEGILDSTASYFYFIRDIERSVVSKIKKGTFTGYDISIPILSAGNTFANTMADGIASLTEKDIQKRHKRLTSFIDGSIELLLLTQGIPYSTPKKLAKGIFGIGKPKPSSASTSDFDKWLAKQSK